MKSKVSMSMAIVWCVALFLVSGLSEAAEKVIKLAHSNDVNSPYHLASQFFAKRVSELTKGKIEVQIYPSSQLGSLRENMEGLQVGTLEMSIPNSADAANFVKEFNVFNIPFLFRDFQHLYKVLDSKLGEEINEACRRKGLRIVGWWVGGSRSVYARRPISDLASMKGMKIRTLPNPIVSDTWKTLGLIPTPMPMHEVYTALQQGVVDAGEGSVISYEGSKYYEVAPYISHVKYLYTVTLLMISEAYMKSLSADFQTAITQAGKESVPIERKINEERENQVIEQLEKKKVVVTKPNLEPFVAAAQPVIEKHGQAIGLDKIKLIQNFK